MNRERPPSGAIGTGHRTADLAILGLVVLLHGAVLLVAPGPPTHREGISVMTLPVYPRRRDGATNPVPGRPAIRRPAVRPRSAPTIPVPTEPAAPCPADNPDGHGVIRPDCPIRLHAGNGLLFGPDGRLHLPDRLPPDGGPTPIDRDRALDLPPGDIPPPLTDRAIEPSRKPHFGRWQPLPGNGEGEGMCPPLPERCFDNGDAGAILDRLLDRLTSPRR